MRCAMSVLRGQSVDVLRSGERVVSAAALCRRATRHTVWSCSLTTARACAQISMGAEKRKKTFKVDGHVSELYSTPVKREKLAQCSRRLGIRPQV
eukprot:746500-Rhodomonas_salina.4